MRSRLEDRELQSSKLRKNPSVKLHIPTPVPRASTELATKLQFEKSGEIREGRGVKPKRIRLFIKPYCGWCQKAIRWLDENEVEYEKIDVISDEAAFDEMIRLSGQELAPVIG